MGFVITGLAIGITLAFLLSPPLIGLGTSVFGAQGAWRMPFIVLGAAAVIIGVGMALFFRGQGGEHECLLRDLSAPGRPSASPGG